MFIIGRQELLHTRLIRSESAGMYVRFGCGPCHSLLLGVVVIIVVVGVQRVCTYVTPTQFDAMVGIN